MLIRKLLYLFIVLAASPATATTFEVSSNDSVTLQASTVAEFDEPWAMTFLPDGTMLVTTKPGKLFHVTQDGDKTEVEGIWEVAYGGQGGLGDVVLHPQFAQNGLVYISSAATTPSWIDRLLSWMESALDRYVISTRGAFVARGAGAPTGALHGERPVRAGRSGPPFYPRARAPARLLVVPFPEYSG